MWWPPFEILWISIKLWQGIITLEYHSEKFCFVKVCKCNGLQFSMSSCQHVVSPVCNTHYGNILYLSIYVYTSMNVHNLFLISLYLVTDALVQTDIFSFWKISLINVSLAPVILFKCKVVLIDICCHQSMRWVFM